MAMVSATNAVAWRSDPGLDSPSLGHSGYLICVTSLHLMGAPEEVTVVRRADATMGALCRAAVREHCPTFKLWAAGIPDVKFSAGGEPQTGPAPGDPLAGDVTCQSSEPVRSGPSRITFVRRRNPGPAEASAPPTLPPARPCRRCQCRRIPTASGMCVGPGQAASSARSVGSFRPSPGGLRGRMPAGAGCRARENSS